MKERMMTNDTVSEANLVTTDPTDGADTTPADADTDPTDDTSDTGYSEPADLRRRREELGVSRRAVQEATGLSSSVVWRSESPTAKKISNDEWTKIDALYANWSVSGVPVQYARPERTLVAASATDVDAQLRAANAAIVRLHDFVTQLNQSVSDKISVARQAKARTKELVALQAEIETFLNGATD
jgi:transcriptional regulator with XRE-family HTH domain